MNERLFSGYEAVIGLEVHCQLKTASKLFCGCSTEFGALPNHHTCPVCLGYPGVLPVVNKQAVNFALKFALAVGANINKISVFSRKQYFYPDLPKGYQISQYDRPFCEGGGVGLSDGTFVSLTRVHMEEDAGKSIHGEQKSYVDLNRAGVALIEIVSEPEIKSPEQASEYLKRIRSIVRYLEISDGNLEQGSFRCDANVSLRKPDDTSFGTKCEIKNLNSFKNVERAIRYEIMRQADVLDHGGSIEQFTMLFDAATGKTKPMRSKEKAHDYRYFPEPDLYPLIITQQRIDRLKDELPELPADRLKRFQDDYGLDVYNANLLTEEKELADFYEEILSKSKQKPSPKRIANWLNTEYQRVLNDRNWPAASGEISAAHLAQLFDLMESNVISGKIAKKVFYEMVDSKEDPESIVEAQGLVQVTDKKRIEEVVDKVLDLSPAQVAEYRAGKKKLFGFFVGQIMKESKGRFNPQIVNKVLSEKLDRE